MSNLPNLISSLPDLWQSLQRSPKKNVLWGMGNGADKILAVCAEKQIPIAGIFASDGFVRHQSFHGMTVGSWDEVKSAYGAENVNVLLSFGSSLPEVLEMIRERNRETDLFLPDVPVFGEGLFDKDYALSHIDELEEARGLLSDEESRSIFDNTVCYKITGRLSYLENAVSDAEQMRNVFIRAKQPQVTADLGAYTGDTVRELLDAGIFPKIVYAMEPDERNYRKLLAYAETETRTEIRPIQAAAWKEKTVLSFEVSGNRNAAAKNNISGVLTPRPAKIKEIQALPLDAILEKQPIDYIKFDVEGSEAEALLGAKQTVCTSYPNLMVSVYHRTEDLFDLPLLVKKLFPDYRGFYLRRLSGVPAWDLNLYVTKEKIQ